MLLNDLVQTSRRVASSSGRLEKVRLLAECLSRLPSNEIAIGVAYLAGELRQGRIGLGGAALNAARSMATESPTLTLTEVDAAFARIASVAGAGSAGERTRILGSLLARATADEQEFVARLIFGELRQGALTGVLLDAVAKAAEVPAPAVRRAMLFAGDLPSVAEAALSGGVPALERFGIVLFRPLEPMLADTAEDVEDAIARLGEAAFEQKLDGARIQVHKSGGEVRIFTRNLNDVTESAPELVESVQRLPARDLILDGEAIAMKPDGSPHTFQTTMRRFGRKLDVETQRRSLPLSAYFFDLLYLEGEPMIDRPASQRFAAMAAIAPAEMVVPRTVTGDPLEAQRFLAAARAAGHEGLVAKALDAPYDAGRRGSMWLKLKPALTLDLVVLAAEWGHGRRSGWLSNLHLGARDPDSGSFVMLGKTFKGMTDELLAWQTEALQRLEIGRDAYTVYVRPELVVEVAFDGLQTSSRYPGGLALRFARIKRYRPDKKAADADTIASVRALHSA